MPGTDRPWPAPAPRKLLLACYEVPGFGGASTSAYDLFRSLRAEGHDVELIFLIEERDRDFFEYTFGGRLGNPAGLPGVTTLCCAGSLQDPQPELARTIAAMAPDVMLAIGYIATLYLRAAAPQRPLVFFTAGSRLAQAAIMDGVAPDAVTLAQKLERGRTHIDVAGDQERRAVDAADLVITHSPMMLDFYHRFHRGREGRLHPRVVWMAEWIHGAARRDAHRARSFGEREIDLLFVASSWDRYEKNFGLLRSIAESQAGAAIHVVGEVARPLPGVVHHGFVAGREAMLALLGNARTVVCPSRIDAAPGILFEASALGCNVVASKNCGNWMLCHPELLVSSYGRDEFVRCAAHSLSRRFEDHLDEFLQPSSYRELVETLTVL